MTEARVGRLLAASMHQAILDVLPQRIDFYENWLTSEGLLDGSIGLAPMTAVIGFLRTEGQAYDPVMARAGRLAAEWTLTSRPPLSRRTIAWMPRALRARAAMRAVAGIARDISSASSPAVRVRRQSARLIVRSSLFCAVREPHGAPLCHFYLALATETLSRFGLSAHGRVECCRAVGAESCVIALELSGAVVSDPALAA
jgi:predicted hydrocarbon binding protein